MVSSEWQQIIQAVNQDCLSGPEHNSGIVNLVIKQQVPYNDGCLLFAVVDQMDLLNGLSAVAVEFVTAFQLIAGGDGAAVVVA